MKPSKKWTAALLCLCLLICLAGCGEKPAEPTVAPTSTPGTTPTVADKDALTLYREAVAAISSAPELCISYELAESRFVSNESYTEKRVGTAQYAKRGSKEAESLVTETVTYGSYSTQYYESFLKGDGYCRVNNTNFRCDMTAEEFEADQIPAVLLDSTLYTSLVAAQAEGGITLAFDGATELESWVTDCENAQLTKAGGSLTLDAAGKLIGGSYHAEFTLLTTSYTLDVTTQISWPESQDLSAQQPVYPEECPTVSDLDIPRYLLRSVGDVYTARNMSVTYQDTMYSQAFGQIRTHTSTYDTYGSGASFMAALRNHVSVTDYTGGTVSNSQTALYMDGQYTYQYNDGEPTVDSSITAEQVRINWEDSILSALMMPEYIENAEISDTGDFLCIQFQGNDALAKSLCSSIYSLFGMDLDAFAESYSTEYIKGYLTVNKYTGLPTAMGMSLSRSHVISKVAYQLTYQLDQALDLSSDDAYENITGEAPAETGTASSTPLFYKVTDENGNILWLMGTIHVGDERTANLPQAILDAFAASDALAVECDNDRFAQSLATDSALQSQLSEIYYYSDGSDISAHLSEEAYNQLLLLMLASGENSINAPYLKAVLWNSQLENFFLAQTDTYRPDKGMESRLIRWAAEQGKAVYEIESVMAQLQMLAGFSEALQEMLLQQTMELGIAGTYDQVTQLYELWCQGDEKALTDALTADTSNLTEEELVLMDEYNKAVITDRNLTMLDAATRYLASGETVFYAVGLGHVLGEGGLVALLQEAGCTVEQVTYQ